MDKKTEVARLGDIDMFLAKAQYGVRLFENAFQSDDVMEELRSALLAARDNIEAMIQERNKPPVKYRIVFTATEHHHCYSAGHLQKGKDIFTDKDEAVKRMREHRNYWIKRGISEFGVEGMETWHVGLERVEG
jgi:hypothetical protein